MHVRLLLGAPEGGAVVAHNVPAAPQVAELFRVLRALLGAADLRLVFARARRSESSVCAFKAEEAERSSSAAMRIALPASAKFLSRESVTAWCTSAARDTAALLSTAAATLLMSTTSDAGKLAYCSGNLFWETPAY